MRHSATRVICTSSEPGAGRRCPQRFPRKIASATFQFRQTLKRLPQELFETLQRNEIKGFISGHVHRLTTSIQEAPRMRG